MNRRRRLLTLLTASLLAASGSAAVAAVPGGGSPAKPTTLRTENLVDPIGIDAAKPLLSWLPPQKSATGQAAYEIRATVQSPSQQRERDLWDSGQVRSASTSNIAYAGPALHARDRVRWEVRTWDAAGRVSPWSDPSTWEMGLLTPADWSARWIENPSYDYTQPDGKETPLPVFGKAFAVHGAVKQARLYTTGLGMYAATLNGRPVGEAVLEPGQTTYTAEVDYRTYDLTRALRAGTNTIGLQTGSGTYQRVKTPGRYFFGGTLEQYTVYGEPKVIAQLEITYQDGHREVVSSDGTWRTALGPTTFSSWWSGEEYDARRDGNAPTSAAALAGAGWQQANPVTLTQSTTPRDTTPLRANPRPPITVAQTVRPTSVRKLADGSYLFDFGANRSGWPSVSVTGHAGDTVTMIPAEKLAADGSLDIASTGASAGNQIAYRYTLSGHGRETWHPQFTYSGFRYLQVSGLRAAPTSDTVTVDVIHAANPSASEFTSSSDLLNQIHAITERAIQSNMTSVMTDCPDREKGPYTGDNLQNLDALLTDYDMSAFEPQLVRNMATAQRQPGDASPGLIANIAPEFHRVAPTTLPRPQGTIEFLDEVNWGGAVIRIPWQLYLTYGDTRTMATYYDNMVAWLDYEARNKAANNGDIPGLGDWSATDNTTPMQLAITAGYYTAASDLASIAQVLGKTADHATYSALAAQLAAEFTTRFRHVDAAGVYYGSDSEASDAMALDAGLVAPADRAAVLDRLVASVRKAGNHITTGSVALGPLFRALENGNRDDVIYDLVVNPTSPGYGYLVASGHTTLSESLDGSGSQNHHFLGAVDAWFIRGVAGIRQAEGSVGYRSLTIAPALVGDLNHAAGSYRTPYGTVSTDWTKSGHDFRLHVTVPPGTTATVHVPVAANRQIQVAGAARMTGGNGTETVYTVGGGDYTFSATI
ncbi:family 78 glycoside hydrolase catalytic domain [Amycolatopsis sp. NPDC051903]|uniref:family 78 glycoside hydrolase catalytic domain n=1 Tax=Amycolatopsis sp. NPDC051903 TaxID=3363936 RepID=UPI0037938550